MLNGKVMTLGSLCLANAVRAAICLVGKGKSWGLSVARSSLKRTTAVIAAMAALSSPAIADYRATGKIEGSFCSGFVVYYCGFEQIDAVAKDDRPYEVATRYETVDDHEGDQCWVTIHDSWFNWIIGDIPKFYQYVSGPEHLLSSYRELGTPEFLVFPCSKDP